MTNEGPTPVSTDARGTWRAGLGRLSLPALLMPRQASFADIDRVMYCIGAQKAGTTWLHAQCAAHPGIHVPIRKEVHYWDTIHPPHVRYYRHEALQKLAALEALALPRRLARDWKGIGPDDARRYRDLLHIPDAAHARYQHYVMQGARGQRVAADISPGYAMIDAGGFADMQAAAPDARFVFILRDPVDRLWSNLRHNRSRGFQKGGRAADLNAALAKVLSKPHAGPVVRSDYARTIAALERAVPASQILYLFYETMFTVEAMRRLSDFLGVKPFAADLGGVVNLGADGGARPDRDLARRARGLLDPVYRMAEARFGPDLPDAWRRHDVS